MSDLVSGIDKLDFIEMKLDEADFQAEHSNVKLTHEEVFDSIRKAIHKK